MKMRLPQKLQMPGLDKFEIVNLLLWFIVVCL
ncbi:hypothetical protein HNQ77_002728 [Silvibacterium bohemicum]|uniref:Uncharacterized protein n=1 Tax=Silvibacterium bohemicum TaxID=1577686 RepID=A0A841JTP3_9BACT|nr:hypothetical protein [Silvibacterium bohemicum]